MTHSNVPWTPPPLPVDLPVPTDDGSASHLLDRSIPPLRLASTSGHDVDLAELATGGVVVYVFPRMGAPDQPDPVGWDETPGAYGCTQQSCAFRDRHERFADHGYTVVGLSAQVQQEQQEAVRRLHLPFPLLADAERRLGQALGLPTFQIADVTLYKRLTLVARDREIVKVFYPVFPPDENADEVLAWLGDP